MGEARRRKSLDPRFGQPIEYVGIVVNLDTDESLCEIPFVVPRQESVAATNDRAKAICIQLFSWLDDPFDRGARSRVVAVLGFESLQALQRFWLNSRVPRFVLRLGGDYIRQYRELKGLPMDKLPEFYSSLPEDWDWEESIEAFDPNTVLRLAGG